MEAGSELVQSYYKNTTYNYRMEDAVVSFHEGNPLCGDDITVYCRIQDDRLIELSYDGNGSLITVAAASFFADTIKETLVDDILHLRDAYFEEAGFVVSERRKRARSLVLLATRNALHQRKNDGKHDDFADVLAD